jgi:hypothetical protein
MLPENTIGGTDTTEKPFFFANFNPYLSIYILLGKTPKYMMFVVIWDNDGTVCCRREKALRYRNEVRIANASSDVFVIL